MKHRHLLASLVLPLALLAACGKADDKPAAAKSSSPAVAVVNGKSITKSEFDLYIENVGKQSKREITDAEKTQLLDQFISMKLAAEAAEKEGISKDAKVNDQLQLARMNVIVDAGLQKWLETHPVTDEELRPEYDAQVAQMPREYHARHALAAP